MNRRIFIEAAGIEISTAITGESQIKTQDDDSIYILDGNVNSNGHKYPVECWDYAIEQAKDGKALAMLGSNFDLSKAVLRLTDLHVEKSGDTYRLVGKSVILDTPYAHMLNLGNAYITPVGDADVTDDGTIKNYRFMYWAITSSSSFKMATPIVYKNNPYGR